MIIFWLNSIILSILTLIPLLIGVAFFTLAERKIMAGVQRRTGPNVVGFLGILQPFADGLKLVLKEIIYPSKSNYVLFTFSPMLVLFLSFISWPALPFNLQTIFIDFEYTLLFFLTISSLSVYGILLAGWSSNSKYALLGGIRSISQMIAYEISISLILLPVIAFSGSLNILLIMSFQKMVWYVLPFFPLSIIFFISILAETNRTPFDLAEAEAELVAGYNVEYSGIIFAAFFLAEYANILLMAAFFVILFCGGWSFSFLLAPLFLSLKIVIIAFLFIFIRSNVPRYRFDQLMFIGWKVFLPLTFAFVLFYCGFLIAFNLAPINQSLF